MSLLRIVCVLLLAVAYHTSAAQQVDTVAGRAAGSRSSLSGFVFDAETRMPLAGANVSVVGASTGAATDGAGEFALGGVEGGAVCIEVTHVGYETARLDIAMGDDPGVLRAYLRPTAIVVKGVTASATREYRDRYEVPLASNVVSRTALERRNVDRMGAVLAREPGVAVSTTGPGIIRPVVRGMYESQVLVLLDWVPMMDLRPGGDHVLLVEPEQMERVEVVRGPGSVLYGSDAIGGVVNFITAGSNPFRTGRWAFGGRLLGGFSTLGNMTRGSLRLGTGTDRGFVQGRYGYKKAGNISDPDQEIPNSSYDGSQVDIAGGVNAPGYDGRYVYHLLVADVGVPLNPAIRHSVFEGEKQQLFRTGNAFRTGLEALPDVDVNLSWQRHNRHFHLVKPFETNPDTFEQDMQIFVNVDGYSGQLLPKLVVGENFSARFGADVRHQSANSERRSFLTNRYDSSVTTLSPPRVIPDCQRSDIGALTQTETDLGFAELFAGVRYDWVSATSKQTENSPIAPTDRADASWSGNLGAVVYLPGGMRLPFNVGRGFRSASLLERFFWGPHQTTVDRGNPDLKPETSISFDLGLNMKRDRLAWSVTGFRNQVNDLIYKQSTGDTMNGMGVDTWLNVSRAELLGCEVEGWIQPVDRLGVSAGASFVQGTDTGTDAPLQNMPPLNGAVGVEYQAPVWNAGLDVIWAARPSRPAPNETPTDGYLVPSLHGGVDFARWLGFDLALNLRVTNLLNSTYKDFLSRTNAYYSEPARSVSVSLTAGPRSE